MWLESLERTLSQALSRRYVQRILDRVVSASKNEHFPERTLQPTAQWLARFCTAAEHAASDLKIDLLGRLLLRESASVGSVCLRALRVVDELEDDEIADLFSRVASRVCQSHSEAQCFIAEGALPSDALIALQDCGLASERVVWNSTGANDLIVWKHATIQIVISARDEKGNLMFPMAAGAMLLSRAGSDVCACIPPDTPCVDMVKSIADEIDKHFDVRIAGRETESDAAVPIRQWVSMHS